MSLAIKALEADRAELISICGSLDAASWSAESGCPGWSVKDLVTHMGALFWVVVDPSVLPDIAGMPTEAAQEVLVESRRGMSAAEALNDYVDVSEKAIAVLGGLADVDLEVPLGDLGTYPARLLPSAFSFDHYTHIRTDLFEPCGPLVGPVPPSDELRLAPALDWIEAAVPQQNKDLVNGLAGATEIVITGADERTIRIGEPDRPISGSISSDADSCVRWMTQRGTWEELGVQVEGDSGILNDLRHLKVF